MSNPDMTKITLTMEGLSFQEREELRAVLTTAFAEYADARNPATEYVKELYPEITADHTGVLNIARGVKKVDAKVAQTELRSQLALKLRNSVMSFQTEEREFPILSSVNRDTGLIKTINDPDITRVIRKVRSAP